MKEIKSSKQVNVIKKYNIFCILFIILCASCSKNQPKIELKEFQNNKLNIIEKGALINDKREGYWITLSEKKIITIESFYLHDKLNGPIKLYRKSGKIMSQGSMENDSTNGLWTYYFENGNISAKGLIKNGEKSGKWEFFIENGKLDKKIQYNKGKETVLIDNHLSVPPPPPVLE